MIPIIYLIAYLSTVILRCPYGNDEINILSHKNFYQSIQFQRNQTKEKLGGSIGFYFWIKYDDDDPRVIHEFENPFQYDKNDDGNLILTIEEEKQVKYVIFSRQNFVFFYDAQKMESTKLQEISQQYTWILFLFVINPNLLTFQMNDNLQQQFSINIESDIINLSLGGLQNINGNLNLNVLNGRATKLEALGYLFLKEGTYSQLKNLCIMTQGYILSFEINTLNENTCPIECRKCCLDDSYSNQLNLICDENQNFRNNYLATNSFYRQYLKIKETSQGVSFDWTSPYSFIYIVEEEIKFNCKYGYFEAISNNAVICIEWYQIKNNLSPFQNTETIGCLECLLNMKTWFKEPICKSDFIRIRDQKNSSFKYQEREEGEYDVFLIDENNKLVHLEGVKKFCNFNEQQNCFQLQKQHLNQRVFGECKKNYRQAQQSCVRDSNCLGYSKNICNLCKTGSYLQNEKCYDCPNQCLTCIFNSNVKQVSCNSCIEQYALFEKKCQPCGQFCQSCINEYDQQNNQFFLRCLRCIDDSKYLLSFDGVNCLQNLIPNCQYAFQAFQGNLSISTLDFLFQRQFNISKIQTYCSRCLDYYGFVFPIKKCLKLKSEQCIFGYSLSIFDQNNPIENFEIVLDGNLYIKVSQMKCLIHIHNFNQNCTQIQNCQICEYQQLSSSYICIRCIQGYYVNIFIGQCFFYSDKCFSCYQQNKYLKDSWKQQIRPFYYEFIEIPFNHSYTQYAQSLKKNDFEVVCLTCNDELQEQECSKIKDCYICKKDNNNIICTDCQNDEKNPFTLQNNQCNTCIPQCKVCKKRSNKELMQLNPYFLSELSDEQIPVCLQMKAHNNFYDRDINQFVKCNNFKQGCKKVMVYSIVLDCQFQNYRFEQQWSLVSKLLPEEEDSRFPDIYNLGMEQKTKKIILRLFSNQTLNCGLKDVNMYQDYSGSLFGFFEVELEIIGLHEIIWNLEGNLIFQKFTKVTINGLIIKIQQSWTQKYLIFKGLKSMQVVFKNVIFKHQTERRDHFQLTFYNATIIDFINTTFQDFYLTNNESLISVQNANSPKIISFIQSKFLNFSLIDSQILQIQKEVNHHFGYDKIEFKSLYMNGYFHNSSLIQRQNDFGEIDIYNFTIEQSVIQNGESFIPLFTFKQISINYFFIFRVNFTNTCFIELSQYNQISNMNISQCNLISQVHLIRSTNQTFIENLFLNFSITQNVYSKLSKFLIIEKYVSTFSKFTLNNIILKSNTIYEQSSDINFIDPTSSLIFIEQSTINCTEIYIEKSFGLSEFTFQKTHSIVLSKIKITQGSLFQSQTIYQQFECFLKSNQIKRNGITIFLFSSRYVFIHELIVKQVQNIDYPIIFYLSESKAVEIEKEILVLSSINFSNNILVQTELQTQASLIFIESSQELEIFINESTLSQNVLQAYQYFQYEAQALLININAQYCNLQFSNNFFENNIILNSKASILYIFSANISIKNCSFFQNNKFVYEVLQPHLYWSFDFSQKIYLESLQEKLKIQSLSGNGYFITQNLNINNSYFSDCQGLKATSLYLQITNIANIKIENTVFKVNQFNIYDYTQKGCVVFIDSSASENIRIDINNITVNSIYSTEKGGFLSIKQGNGVINLTMNNIRLIDVFSIQGSIIYFTGLDAKQKQIHLNFKNLYYLSNKETYSNFIIWYNYQIQKQQNVIKQTIILNEILSNQSLIYIYQASTLRMENLQIQNLFLEKVLNIEMVNTIKLSDALIQNSFFKNGIILIKPDKTIEAQIFIEKVQIKNLQFGCLIFENQKLEIIYPETPFQSCQKNDNNQAPTFLESFITSETNFIEKTNSSLSDDCQLSDLNQGMIHFESLNQIHQLKLNQFQIIDVNFSKCQDGVISINFQKQFSKLKKQEINNFIITNSICGLKGCLKISVLPQGKLLNDTKDSYNLENVEFFIFDYICQYNQAQNGTCLYLEEARIIISSCDFRYNNASGAGGTIYSKKSSKAAQLIIKETLISENNALVGGGIYMEEQQEINFQKLDSIISGNKGQFYANDISAIPSQLKVQINGIQDENYQIQAIVENDTFRLYSQKLKNKIKLYGILTNYIMLPNGIQISQYQYFDWKNRIYIPLNFTLRILPLTGMGVQIKNLKNSFCQIKSKIFDPYSNNNTYQEIFTDNYTNLKEVYFNEQTQDYNLDDLIIYSSEDIEVSQIIEIQFWCNSIFVPIYNNKFPYNLISQHNQYYLIIQVSTYPCQLGEIRNQTYQYCQTCNWQEGFFQLKLNQIYCQIRDEISTSEVRPALLKLRTGYWRPYFDTKLIGICQNSEKNCLGGWIEGDTSCIEGHIGALCEQCDLYNIRGHGEFSNIKEYTCQKCNDGQKAINSLTLSMAWTFFMVFVSTYGNIQSSKEKLQILKLRLMGFKVFFNQNFKVIFMKILINYLQVFSSISSFELYFPAFAEPYIYLTIFSSQGLYTKFDCLLSSISNLEIHYLRMIWFMSLPFVCFITFSLLYGFISSLRKQNINLSVIMTTLLSVHGYFYPNLTQYLFQVLSYRSISGYSWISSNVAFRYDTKNHLFWMLYFFIPSAAIISIVIPSVLFRMLYKQRHKLDSKMIRDNFGYLINEYQKNAYFWEILKIVTKEFFCFTLIYFQESIVQKGFMVLLIFLTYQKISMRIKPYQSLRLNKLDLISTQINLITFNLFIGIYNSQNDGLVYMSRVYNIALLCSNLHFLVYLISLILKEYLKSYIKQFYKAINPFLDKVIIFFPNYLILIKCKNYLDNKKSKEERTKFYFTKLKQYLRQQVIKCKLEGKGVQQKLKIRIKLTK